MSKKVIFCTMAKKNEGGRAPKKLSLGQISDIWQNASATTENFRANIPLEDTVFNLGIDESGRAYFFFSNDKGALIALEDVVCGGSPLGLAIDRVKQQRLNTVSWGDGPNGVVYLDQNAEFAYQLFKGERNFRFGKSIVTNAEKTERTAVLLRIDPSEELKEDFSGVDFKLSLVLNTETETLENPVPLCPTYALCGKKIYRTRDLGINYNKLSDIEGVLNGKEIEKFLSLFASIFPSIKIEMTQFSETPMPKTPAEPALHFAGLDESGNLSIRQMWCFDPFPVDFVSENKPSALVRLHVSSRTISRIPVTYGGTESWKKMDSLLRGCISRHPECKEEGARAYDIEGDELYITSALALPFLSENLSDLAQNYRLFGTEALSKFRFKKVTPQTHLSVGNGIDYFDTKCTVEIDGEIMSPRKIVELYEENNFIPLSDGSRAIIDKSFFTRLKRLLGREQKDGTYKISFFDMPLVDSLINAKIENAKESELPWQKFYFGFDTIPERKTAKLPVVKKLRYYQKYGLQWLGYVTENNLGACLADDMGLGKTIQTISLLASAYAKKSKGSSLVVVPKSLIENWKNELSKFAPELSVYAYYGTERSIDKARRHSVILTTYAVVRIDIKILQGEEFEYVVLDEVQQIKNTASQASKAVMLLSARHRIALSGTPMENNLGELYSIFRFLNPPMFGTEGEFNCRYGNPIQKENDEEAARELSAKIRPFILRRLKQEVAKELPERTEQVMYVDMSPEQAALYEQQRIFYQKLIKGEIAKNGFEKSQFCILQALTELRQIATVPESKTEGVVEGAKWERLVDAIAELVESGHRCLVFSNFLASIDAMAERLEKSEIAHLVMTGATTNRAELVKKFQQDGKYKVFLMTLKTGGVGLNLTGADYVFILDPWWNRSAEQQAIDRTHRIGQTRSVFCYRLISRGTIEEKIMELQQKKADLFSAIISSDGQQIKKLTEEDINYLLNV